MALARRFETLPRPREMVGRYEVLAEVAHGGMAAVYAVRLRGPAGFDRLLAMKVLLPHLRADRRFVSMFLDEAKIAAWIHHPNVVQVFELGEHDGMPFLVMEYLRGYSLSGVLSRARSAAHPMPLPVLIAIVIRTAEGLHAAHETKGKDGAPLGIVHRDVSPQNIHVGFDGVVKVVDFGIAAARGRVSTTRTGEIKGKLAYLAPEQVKKSADVDRRADLWALGVLTWEAITRRRLFLEDDDATTLWNVLHKEVEQISVDGVPQSLLAVVRACLERSPDERPSTAAELAARLREATPVASEPEVAAYMCTLFDADHRAEEARLTELLRTEPTPETRVVETPTPTPLSAARPSSTWRWVLAGSSLLFAAAAAALAMRDDASSSPPPSAVADPPAVAPVAPESGTTEASAPMVDAVHAEVAAESTPHTVERGPRPRGSRREHAAPDLGVDEPSTRSAPSPTETRRGPLMGNPY